MSEQTNPPFLLARAFSPKGELALVTGGASGLGRAIAHAYAEAGAQVVLTGRRRDQLQTATAELGPNAHFATHDVADTGKAPALATLVKERFGRVTILVNNAGNHFKKSIEDTDELEFRQLMDTHGMGAYPMTKAFIPSMS